MVMKIGFWSAIGFLLPSLAVSAPAAPTGSWAGEMRQVEVSTEATYPMTLVFRNGSGKTDYPTLNCGGELTEIATHAGYTIYSEKVTNRKGATCIDGLVTVKIEGGTLILGWFAAYAGEPSLAAASLTKVARSSN
jgi:hypothetical protein